MKFTERGSISIGYRISEAKDEIYFFCKDTGMGIAADKLELVFERFVKLNTFVKGTGLGLAISRVIVERLGGTIGVDSEEGEGACFWFLYSGYFCFIKIESEDLLKNESKCCVGVLFVNV